MVVAVQDAVQDVVLDSTPLRDCARAAEADMIVCILSATAETAGSRTRASQSATEEAARCRAQGERVPTAAQA